MPCGSEVSYVVPAPGMVPGEREKDRGTKRSKETKSEEWKKVKTRTKNSETASFETLKEEME